MGCTQSKEPQRQKTAVAHVKKNDGQPSLPERQSIENGYSEFSRREGTAVQENLVMSLSEEESSALTSPSIIYRELTKETITDDENEEATAARAPAAVPEEIEGSMSITKETQNALVPGMDSPIKEAYTPRVQLPARKSKPRMNRLWTTPCNSDPMLSARRCKSYIYADNEEPVSVCVSTTTASSAAFAVPARGNGYGLSARGSSAAFGPRTGCFSVTLSPMSSCFTTPRLSCGATVSHSRRMPNAYSFTAGVDGVSLTPRQNFLHLVAPCTGREESTANGSYIAFKKETEIVHETAKEERSQNSISTGPSCGSTVERINSPSCNAIIREGSKEMRIPFSRTSTRASMNRVNSPSSGDVAIMSTKIERIPFSRTSSRASMNRIKHTTEEIEKKKEEAKLNAIRRARMARGNKSAAGDAGNTSASTRSLSWSTADALSIKRPCGAFNNDGGRSSTSLNCMTGSWRSAEDAEADPESQLSQEVPVPAIARFEEAIRRRQLTELL